MPHFVNEINLCTSTHDENSYTNIDFFYSSWMGDD